MFVKSDLLKKLRSAFELNEYEVKIWVSILSKGIASAGELADMGNVPRSRTYDVLESLEKKGFIIMKLGRPIQYLAVAPEEIINRVKKGIEKEAEEQLKNIEKIKDTDVFDELSGLFKNGIDNVDPNEISGSLKGRTGTYNQINTILGNAKEEVIIATTDLGIIRKAKQLKTHLSKLKKQGVKIRIGAPLRTEEAKSAAEELKIVGNVKSMDLNARFVIVDGKEMVFMLNDDKNIHESADASIWVNASYFAGAMKNLFELNYR